MITTPYNVWGNVTFDPIHSNISNWQMLHVEQKLDQIVTGTNAASVDQVFQLLLSLDLKTEFVTGFHAEAEKEIESLSSGQRRAGHK